MPLVLKSLEKGAQDENSHESARNRASEDKQKILSDYFGLQTLWIS